MAIVKMKKVEAVVALSDKRELLEDLQKFGQFQISEFADPGKIEEGEAEDGAALEAADEALVTNLTKASAAELTEAKSDHSLIENAIYIVKKQYKEKKPLLSALPTAEKEAYLNEDDLDRAVELANAVNTADETIRKNDAEIIRLKNALEQLAPWQGLGVSMNFAGTEHTDFTLLSFPIKQDLSKAKAALESECPESELIEVSADEVLKYASLITLKGSLEDAMNALRPFSASVMSLPSKASTPVEAHAEGASKIEALRKQNEELLGRIQEKGAELEELRKNSDIIAAQIMRLDAEQRVLETEHTVLMRGWVPADYEEKLVQIFEKYGCAYEIRDPEKEEYPDVPIKLKNGLISRSLNVITDMYSYPAYDGVDANPYMAPFFILFYGIMMADMGYGILMMVLTALILKKRKPKGGFRRLVELIFWCGISTFIMGALTGGFFGDAPLQVAKILNPDTTWQGLPALFTPIDDTIAVMLGAMALGLVHLMVGMGVNFAQQVKAGDAKSAIFNEGAWYVIFAGIPLAILKLDRVAGIPVVLTIGIIMLIYGAQAGAKGFGKITAVFGAIYNGVTGYIGDILSYSRLMALMLAGSVIASVFNIIGGVTGNLFGFLVISIIGNALNFGLNILGCFVHDLRLQCLEFFGKFYKDGGKPFRPLEISPKYSDVAAK